MHKRVLIIATTPYSENYSSRAMDAEFHYWEKEKVAQIYTRNIVPKKGHCAELYQITDSNMLKRWLHKTKETGLIYRYEELSDSGENEITDNGTMQKLGTKHTPTIEILRRILWRKKYWCTDKLNNWLDSFNPECIFYNFSNHIFTQQIALYVAEKYNIPIITAIGDDYFFNDRRSLSPAYHLFRRKFKTMTRRILKRKNSSAVYCSDKIRDKYNAEFDLTGETIYLNSTLERRPFAPIDLEHPVIAYFGNIRLGRNHALVDVASALASIDPKYRLEVYSGETDPAVYDVLKKHPNIDYKGKIPYDSVKNRMAECDLIVVVEGFKKEDLIFTRYSLSTKAADSLASGVAVLAYGPEDAGVIGYLKETKAVAACTTEKDLEECIKKLFSDIDFQKSMYEKAIEVYRRNHTVESSCSVFEKLVDMVVEG